MQSFNKRSSNIYLYYFSPIDKTSNYSFIDIIPILLKDLNQLEKGIISGLLYNRA
jgi:hypothetical protein